MGNTMVLIACLGMLLILGIAGFYYEKHRGIPTSGAIAPKAEKKEKTEIPSFYTVTDVANTITVGGQGYFVNLDITFLLKGGKEEEKALQSQESRLRDIAIASMSNTHFDIRTPTGKKEVQREILRKVRALEPNISEVLFPNILMLRVYGSSKG